MQQGDYDGVIDKTVKKLIKDPSDQDDIKALDRAYKLANERDLARIKLLKTENNPAGYDEIFRRYESLRFRQQKVRTVLPLQMGGRTINYDYIDYDAELVSAKKSAAEYYYQHGKELLQNPDKESARTAHHELSLARDYSGDAYPDLNDLLLEARERGVSRVIVEVQNSERIMVSPEFRDELLTFNTSGLSNEWVEYHFRHLNQNINYDYAIVVNLLDILVSPEEVKTEDKIYRKEIEDGFDYVLDQNGNVMKDSTGNDIKIPKYKTLQSTLIETFQRKTLTIRGQVEIIQLSPSEKLLIKEPVAAENVFQHSSARAVGDKGALDQAALQKLENEYIPFPPDVEMIFSTAETLKPAIRNAIYRNRRYIY